jgi:hypothetical protein
MVTSTNIPAATAMPSEAAADLRLVLPTGGVIAAFLGVTTEKVQLVAHLR